MAAMIGSDGDKERFIMDFLDSTTLIVVLVLCGAGVIVVGSILLFVVVSRAARNPQIENGILGQATILRIWETGITVNDRPQVGFSLNVQHPDGSSYEAETKAVVSLINLPQVQPGATVAVKIDPNNRSRVALA
jgi:hypothetical protein